VNCLRLLSRFFNDLREEGQGLTNPVAALDRATWRAIGPKHDPRRTPYLRRLEDVRAVFLALPPPPSPLRPMFAVGVFAGLRTGEVRALERADVDLRARRIHVQRSVGGPVKDGESRFVPINDTLLPVLREWMLRRGEGRLLFPPSVPGRGGRPGREPTHVREATLGRHLREALRRAGLDGGLTWYQCTRHTFASHWAMAGGSMRKLSDILGHVSVTTTERYAHLSPDIYGRADYEKVCVDLRKGGEVVELGCARGEQEPRPAHELGTNQDTLPWKRQGGRCVTC
jgi:integrase